MAPLIISKILTLFILLAVVLPYGNSFSFNFSSFSPNDHTISMEGDSLVSNGAIHLTKSTGLYSNLTGNAGRATYRDPIFLSDSKTGTLVDFTTRFSFIIKPIPAPSADGLTFFIGESDSVLPLNSSGGHLGLFDPVMNGCPILAVEFDTFSNSWDPPHPHVGIDINNIVSAETVPWLNALDGQIAHVLINYISRNQILNVYLSYVDGVFGNPILSYVVDLRKILPGWVRIGFSASTGTSVELHQILSWEFDSYHGN